MGGRGNEPSKPVFSPFVRLKDIFACERSTITRWKNVDRATTREIRCKHGGNEKSGHRCSVDCY